MAQENSKPWLSLRSWPWATIGLLILNTAMFSWEMRANNVGLSGLIIDEYDFAWSAFVSGPFREFPTLFSHTLLHADAAHLFFNMLFLLIFAPPVEHKIGRFLFIMAYFLWGSVAGLAQGAFSPFSRGLIGASGAISGVMGAYIVLYPIQVPSSSLLSFLGKASSVIPSFFWVGLYILSQVKAGVLSLLPETLLMGVPRVGYWAHLGGFLLGALCMGPVIFKNAPKNRVEN